MSDLAKKLQRSRERVVEVGGFRFHFRRPSACQAAQLYNSNASSVDIATQFVFGWDNVRECDIVKGGTTEAAAFSPELWREWCHDRSDFWLPVRDAIVKSYTDFMQQQESAEKN